MPPGALVVHAHDQLGFVASLIGATSRSTISPTVLSARGKTNVIPAEASARLDIRVPPGQGEALRKASVLRHISTRFGV